MGIRIGIGSLKIGQGSTGVDWSSYWTTRTPTVLILTTPSDTQIDGTFTINGEGQDGHKVYTSSDGTTYTLSQTLTGTDNTFSITELTSGTKLWIMVVAYKGTNESDGIVDYAVTSVETILGDTSKTWAEYNVENAESLVQTDGLVSQVKNVRDLAGALGNRKLTNINHGLTPSITETEGLLFDGSTALNGYDLDYAQPCDIYIIMRQNEWVINKKSFNIEHAPGSVICYNKSILPDFEFLGFYAGEVLGPQMNLQTGKWVLLKISINDTTIKVQINDRYLKTGACGVITDMKQICFGGDILGTTFGNVNLLRAIFRTGGDSAAIFKSISDRLQYEYKSKLAVTPDTHENTAVALIGDSITWYLDYYHLMDEYTTSHLAQAGVGIQEQHYQWDQQTYSLQASFEYIFMLLSLNEYATTIEVFVAKYQALINQIRVEAPNAKIIGATLTPCVGNVYWEDKYDLWLAMNEAIRGEGANPITGFDYICTEHTTEMDDGTGALKPEYDGGDHLHLTEAGYTVIANKYKEVIV